MRQILLYCLAFVPLFLDAQKSKVNFSFIDRAVLQVNENNPDSLARKLAALGNSDLEKVRAFYSWITNHIDYNLRVFNRNKTNPGAFFEEVEDSSGILPSLDYRVAEKVVVRRTAFCDGYSRLFKTLCDLNDIPSVIIHGYARTNQQKNYKFGVNHTWNAVYIDSVWHLLDLTWASGYVSYSNRFIRQINDFYFLTSPADFIKDHYPEDLYWTLLEDPPVYREFSKGPFQHSGFFKYGVNFFSPENGILNRSVGDSVLIEFSTSREIRNYFLSGSISPDSFPAFDSQQLIKTGEKLGLHYTISSAGFQWLYLFCNEEPVLRYRINATEK